MENKKIYVLFFSHEDEYSDRIDVALCASFNKNIIEKLKTEKENETAVISYNEWIELSSKFDPNSVDDDDEIVSTAEGIYYYVTKKYTLKQLEEAEELYDFDNVKKYYYIEEIDYYELKISKK